MKNLKKFFQMLDGMAFLLKSDNFPIHLFDLLSLLSEIYLVFQFCGLYTYFSKLVSGIDSSSCIKRLHEGECGI